MTQFAGRVSVLAALLLARTIPALGAAAEDIAALRSEVLALGQLTTPPVVHAAEGFPATDGVRAIYYDALPWQGKPTRVFAWLGVPAGGGEKKPAIVLVQGGGGTAFKEWVRKWNDQGFVAISIAVEGQTDERIRRSRRMAPGISLTQRISGAGHSVPTGSIGRSEIRWSGWSACVCRYSGSRGPATCTFRSTATQRPTRRRRVRAWWR